MQKTTKLILQLLLIVVIISFLLYFLVNYPALRPYLIAVIAAAGTLFGGIPRLLSDTPLARWTAVLIASVFVGLGTWYTAVKLQQEKTELQFISYAQNQTITALSRDIKELPSKQLNAIIIKVALALRERYRQNDFSIVDELSKVLLELDSENGHGLYFAGEYWRSRNDRVRMRGHFYRYFATADIRPDSKTGLASECYNRPKGYCAERTAWISHLMANDFYQEALCESNKIKRRDILVRANKFIISTLEHFPGGFTQLKPTNLLDEDIKRELKMLGEDKVSP